MTPLCPICARRQPTTGYTCSPCFDRLAQQLNDIQREAELLTATPSLAAPTGGRGGTLAAHRAPARVDALALADTRTNTDSAIGVLATWARIVREDRALTPPDRITLPGECATLTRHLDWIAAQPWIDEFATQLGDLLARLRRANPDTLRARTIGRCPQPDCGGPIRRRPQQHTMWRDEGDRCTAHAIQLHDGPAYCGRCRATWEGPDMARLALILERQEREAKRPTTDDGRPMLTAQELVDAGHSTSVSNVRVTAHRRGVRAVNGHYDPAVFERQEVSA
jgi:hypothetical protein